MKLRYTIPLTIAAAAGAFWVGAQSAAQASPAYDPENMSNCWPTHEGDLAVVTLQGNRLQCSLLRDGPRNIRFVVDPHAIWKLQGEKK
jgi:hypothetical protein